MSVRTKLSLLLGLVLGLSILLSPVQAQTSPNSNPPASPSAAKTDPSWLFPVDKLDHALPPWIHLGGEYRLRPEGPINTGYTDTKDFYLLDRLRVVLGLHPKEWLTFWGEVQDARIFFNHHIPNANPYQDTWTLWQGYGRVGSTREGWIDGLAGRQVLTFGDERVIGPSDWLNVGRTFDVARIDLHHPGFNLAIFGSSV